MLYYEMQNNKKTPKNILSNFFKLLITFDYFGYQVSILWKFALITFDYFFKLLVAEDGFELSRLKCAI